MLSSAEGEAAAEEEAPHASFPPSQPETMGVPGNEVSGCILCDCRDSVGTSSARSGATEHKGSATEHS